MGIVFSCGWIIVTPFTNLRQCFTWHNTWKILPEARRWHMHRSPRPVHHIIKEIGRGLQQIVIVFNANHNQANRKCVTCCGERKNIRLPVAQL